MTLYARPIAWLLLVLPLLGAFPHCGAGGVQRPRLLTPLRACPRAGWGTVTLSLHDGCDTAQPARRATAPCTACADTALSMAQPAQRGHTGGDGQWDEHRPHAQERRALAHGGQRSICRAGMGPRRAAVIRRKPDVLHAHRCHAARAAWRPHAWVYR